MNTLGEMVNLFEIVAAITEQQGGTQRDRQLVQYSHRDAAKIFAALNGGVIRRCGKTWAVWCDTHWELHGTTAAEGAMSNFLEAYAYRHMEDVRERVGDAAGDPAAARALARAETTAVSIKGGPWARETLKLAQPLMVHELGAFDADPWLINVRNGVVDLRTGKLMPHDPKYMMTKCAAVDYSEASSIAGTRFEQFVSEVFRNDPEAVRYMQRQLGYCLTGDNNVHELFFWYGSGRNGKSTLAELVMDLMGSYARKIGAEVLMASKAERHKTEVAQFLGVRLAVASEIDKGSYWNESRIKELTGDKTISARFIAQDNITFTRTHKLIIQGNNRPHLKEIDKAIIKRMRMVPFAVDFDAAGQIDPNLPQLLRVEAGAVFGWMVQGAMAVYQAGCKVGTCKMVGDATDEYLKDNDTLKMWMTDNCVPKENAQELNEKGFPKVRCSIRKLYRDYAEWKKERGEGVEGERGFKEMLLKAGFKEFRVEGVTVIGHLGLLEDARVPSNVVNIR